MKYCHNDYMNYEVPDDWCVEYEGDNLLIYDDVNGEGAMVFSFYSVFETENTLVEQISQMGVKFVNQNEIKLFSPFILEGFNTPQKKFYGQGTLPDGMYIKLWIVALYPKIAVITYQSEAKTKEVEICDKIVDSISFNF